MICEECKQEFGSTSLYAAHLCTPTEDRQRIAELKAQLADAKAHIKQLEVCVAKLEGELAINMRVKQSLEIKQRDEFFRDLANNMPDEFGD